MIFFSILKKKLDIALQKCFYQSEINHYLRTKIYKRTRFNKKGSRTFILYQIKVLNTKYECKSLLQKQSIYYAQEDKKDTAYYLQIPVEQCGYKDFIEYNIVHKDFVFTDSEPESEEEFNDDNHDTDEYENNNHILIM